MQNIFLRKRVRTDQRWDAGVVVGVGQPGSRAMARRSLAVVQPYEYPMGGEAQSYVGWRRVASGGATRFGSGGPHDRPPLQKNR
jgi:hypothetical protein